MNDNPPLATQYYHSTVQLDECMVRTTVLVAISEAADVVVNVDDLHRHLYREIGLDSLDAVAMAVQLRKRFPEIIVPETEAAFMEMDTPEKVIQYVLQQL